jgi:hypothetical protein
MLRRRASFRPNFGNLSTLTLVISNAALLAAELRLRFRTRTITLPFKQLVPPGPNNGVATSIARRLTNFNPKTEAGISTNQPYSPAVQHDFKRPRFHKPVRSAFLRPCRRLRPPRHPNLVPRHTPPPAPHRRRRRRAYGARNLAREAAPPPPPRGPRAPRAGLPRRARPPAYAGRAAALCAAGASRGGAAGDRAAARGAGRVRARGGGGGRRAGYGGGEGGVGAGGVEGEILEAS